MSRKMCPKIILEGTRLTFKTEIAFALNEHPADRRTKKIQVSFAHYFRGMVFLYQFSLGPGDD
jgi:hypothetical protein